MKVNEIFDERFESSTCGPYSRLSQFLKAETEDPESYKLPYLQINEHFLMSQTNGRLCYAPSLLETWDSGLKAAYGFARAS